MPSRRRQSSLLKEIPRRQVGMANARRLCMARRFAQLWHAACVGLDFVGPMCSKSIKRNVLNRFVVFRRLKTLHNPEG